MEQVFIYNKTFQDRLREFTNVLGSSKLRSVSDIKKEWALYLELTMDPNGWQAIWKISRLMCEELSIEYPMRALVYVDMVDFKELTASICVLTVQNDVVLPSRYYVVPLVQLTITQEQDKSVGLNLESTANCLDMLTFFYTNIIMPWDYDDEDTDDWLRKHLESRLHLFYDMNNQSISKSNTERLDTLLNKARRLHAYRTNLALNMAEYEDDEDIQKFLDIHVSLALIRSEVEILGNPLFRNVFYDGSDELQLQKNATNWIVFQINDTVDDQIALLNMVKELIESDAIIRPVSKLTEALQFLNAGDCIYFNKGIYEISETAFLPTGVIMKGFNRAETILTATNDDILLNCSGGLVLESISLDVKTAQCGILVHSGSVLLKDCNIVGDGKTSTHRGVIVLGDSKLKIQNCHISSFYTAIIGYSLSSIVLENCKVVDVTQGLKLFDKCHVDAEDVIFSKCKDYGILVETEEMLNDGIFKQGNFELLKMFPEVKLQNVTTEDVGKGDAMIIHKTKLKPITDLFSNPDLDPTIIHDDSNDEMNI